MAKGNKTNHPRKFMRWDDWQTWLLKEWYPKMNDLAHLRSDMSWVKKLLLGLILIIIAAAIAILVKG